MSDTGKTTPVEFRLRFWIFGLIYVLGFSVPWDWALHLDGSGPNAHTWGRLAVELTKTGSIAIDGAFNVVLAVAMALAFAGAWLRTWGSAYLDSDAVLDPALRSEPLTADGPYRYVRNPLCLGTMFLTLALAVLMPASGAVFAVAAIALLLGRLIFVEERFLAQSLGTPYAEYCARVGRIVPALRPQIPARGERPHWLRAFLGEIFAWGVAGSFAAAGWRYNAGLLTQCVLVSLGVWLIVRAFPLRHPAEQPRG
jgi:hypothetical protein